MNAEIHFFDLDGVLWNIDGKVWIISKDAPNVPLVKLDKEEFSLIRAGVYKSDNVQIEYNGEEYWISNDILSRVGKKRKLEPTMLGFSFRELFDTNSISSITMILKNIVGLQEKQVDVGILTGRHNQEGEKEYVNQLRLRLNDMGLDINKIYYLGDRYRFGLTDNISFAKTRVILEHMVGIKVDKDRFVPLKQDWYKRVYFYDDEVQNIYTANRIQDMFNSIIRNTDDEVYSIIMERVSAGDLTLYTNLVTNNNLNKFKSEKIILQKPTKYPIQLEQMSIQPFSKFKNNIK